eukprot:s3923_g1.t1
MQMRQKIKGWWLVFNGTSTSIKSDVPEKAGRGFDEHVVNMSDVDVAIVFDFNACCDGEAKKTQVAEVFNGQPSKSPFAEVQYAVAQVRSQFGLKNFLKTWGKMIAFPASFGEKQTRFSAVAWKFLICDPYIKHGNVLFLVFSFTFFQV